jgi:hypothetical protein
LKIERDELARLRRIETELRPAALGVGLGFPATFLVRRFKRAQPADFFQNPFGIQFVLQAFERSIDRFTFTNYHFRHASSSFLMAGFTTGAAENKRLGGGRQLL